MKSVLERKDLARYRMRPGKVWRKRPADLPLPTPQAFVAVTVPGDKDPLPPAIEPAKWSDPDPETGGRQTCVPCDGEGNVAKTKGRWKDCKNCHGEGYRWPEENPPPVPAADQ